MKSYIREVLSHKQVILSKLDDLDIKNSYVYAAGSLMEGFGNSTSDIDIYVICDKAYLDKPACKLSSSESLIRTENNLIRNVIQDGVRFDFEYWSWEDFNEIIRKLNGLDFKTEGYITRLSDDEYDLLHRLKYAKPLVNEEKFYMLYDSIVFENLRFYQVVVQSEKYSSFLEDLQGASSSGDYGSTFIMVRRLIDLVVTSYLAVNGETNPNLKWMYRKLARYQEITGDTVLLMEYLRLQTYPFTEDTIKSLIREAMKFCQNLNLKAQMALREKQVSKS